MKIHSLKWLIVVTSILSLSFCFEKYYEKTEDVLSEWTDPEWSEMIEKSEVIALCEVVKEGTWQAEVKVVEVFKGKLSDEKIWVGEYNDSYGSPKTIENETFRKGERYFLFLFQIVKLYPNKNQNRDFVKAVQTKNAYAVWTPSAGDILVNGTKVYYDLSRTSWSKYNSPHDFDEFREFLSEAIKFHQYKEVNTSYTQKTISKLSESLKRPNKLNSPGQYINILDICGNNSFQEIFRTAVMDTLPETRYALAKHLNKIEWKQTKPLFAKLLNDTHPVIQTTVVRLLSKKPPDDVAPLLLAQLDSIKQDFVFQPNLECVWK